MTTHFFIRSDLFWDHNCVFNPYFMLWVSTTYIDIHKYINVYSTFIFVSWFAGFCVRCYSFFFFVNNWIFKMIMGVVSYQRRINFSYKSYKYYTIDRKCCSYGMPSRYFRCDKLIFLVSFSIPVVCSSSSSMINQ